MIDNTHSKKLIYFIAISIGIHIIAFKFLVLPNTTTVKHPKLEQKNITLKLLPFEPARTSKPQTHTVIQNSPQENNQPSAQANHSLSPTEMAEQYFSNPKNQQRILSLNPNFSETIKNHQSQLSKYFEVKFLTRAEKEQIMIDNCLASTICREAIEGNNFSNIYELFPLLRR